jgi:hypothetical protein
MKSILLALALAAGSAHATYDMLLTSGKNTLRLYEGACVHAGTLALIKPEMRPQFRKAMGIFNGKIFFGCWTYEEDGPKVLVIYEDGDQQRYDPDRFKPDAGI